MSDTIYNEEDALTWDEVANIYDSRKGGRKARTLPMALLFDWVASQDDFFVDDEGYIYQVKS